MGSPDNIFEVVDPRGYLVVCSKDVWDGHITISHDDFPDGPEPIAHAITDPDIVYQSKEYQRRDVYFRRVETTVDEHVKVVVEMETNYGEVVTAFVREGIRGNIDEGVVKYVKP